MPRSGLLSWLPSPRTRSLARWRAMDRPALGRTGGAAVDHDLGAGPVCRVARREIEHRLRDVLGFAHAGEWHAAPPRLMPGLLDTALVVCFRRRNPDGGFMCLHINSRARQPSTFESGTRPASTDIPSGGKRRAYESAH